MIAMSLALVLVSAGCTGGKQDAPGASGQRQEDVTPTTSQVPVGEDTGVAADSAVQPPIDGSPVDADTSSTDQRQDSLKLAGMYGWDPEGGFHNAVLQGRLVVDAPCVYLEVSEGDDDAPQQEAETLRGFLRLPEPLTRYDADSDAVWVGDHGPMSSGDEVVLTGSEGWQPGWSVNEDGGMHDFAFSWELESGCPAQVSFWVALMSPATPSRIEPPDPGGQQTWLAGLFPWDIEQVSTDIGADMVLVLEPPCVFAVPVPVWESREAGSRITHRYLLRLPRPLVRLNAASNSLWVGDHGPMTTGDKVQLNDTTEESVYGSEYYEGGCSARGTIRSAWLMPATGSANNSKAVAE